FAVRWFSGDADFWENGYTFFIDLARNIAAGKGIAFDGQPPTAFRVPLYPAFLAAVTFGHEAFLSIVFWQSVIGAGTVVCTALIARELFGSTAALVAAAITAIYPYYVVHDTALQETSMFTFVTALAVFLLLQAQRRGSSAAAVGAGLALAAAVLTRAALAPFAMLAPMCLLVPATSRMQPAGHRLRVAALCAAVLAMAISPWFIRSYLLHGSATLSTETGFFLWL